VDIPYVSYDMAKLMYTFGESLVADDKGDIGYFKYKGRKSHRYHGKKSPNHQSELHHWMWGGLLIAAAEIAGTIATLREAQEALKQT
jgi:hypothetical protein